MDKDQHNLEEAYRQVLINEGFFSKKNTDGRVPVSFGYYKVDNLLEVLKNNDFKEITKNPVKAVYEKTTGHGTMRVSFGEKGFSVSYGDAYKSFNRRDAELSIVDKVISVIALFVNDSGKAMEALKGIETHGN